MKSKFTSAKDCSFKEAKNHVDTHNHKQWVAKGKGKEQAEMRNHLANSTEIHASGGDAQAYRDGWERIFGKKEA